MRICVICGTNFINIGREVCCSLKCKVVEGSEKQKNGCWIWKRYTSGSYGKIRYKMRYYSAHRASYQSFVQNIPLDKWVCHKCDNPLCVNPEHLFIGSASDNRKDAVDKKRVPLGENNHFSKFTDIQVSELRQLREEGFTYSRLRRIFNCSFTYIGYILKNKYRKE